MDRRTFLAVLTGVIASAGVSSAHAGREHKWNDNDNSDDTRGKQTSVSALGVVRAYGTISTRDCTIRQSQNVSGCDKDFNGGYTVTFKTPMASDTYVVVANYDFAEGGGTVVNVSNRTKNKVSFRVTNVDAAVSYAGDLMFMVLGE